MKLAVVTKNRADPVYAAPRSVHTGAIETLDAG